MMAAMMVGQKELKMVEMTVVPMVERKVVMSALLLAVMWDFVTAVMLVAELADVMVDWLAAGWADG
jgi:hypothetical protein